ncbi:hypothetical protein HAX54_006395 [Datura stramonium]|uniref:Uncharacterized protein n=1 Tax=Datura stramonium TaxID=4076 RepID=A0ABS8TCL8_DATST|nr:hypothetical protein [Datura stramonium]
MVTCNGEEQMKNKTTGQVGIAHPKAIDDSDKDAIKESKLYPGGKADEGRRKSSEVAMQLYEENGSTNDNSEEVDKVPHDRDLQLQKQELQSQKEGKQKKRNLKQLSNSGTKHKQLVAQNTTFPVVAQGTKLVGEEKEFIGISMDEESTAQNFQNAAREGDLSPKQIERGSLEVYWGFLERLAAYSALYHNSFSGIVVHERRHGTSVSGGSLTFEREVRPIPFILV